MTVVVLSGCSLYLSLSSFSSVLIFYFILHIFDKILSSNKRQEIKKGSPEPILPINSSLQSNSDEEDSQPDTGLGSVESELEKGTNIHPTVETNHVDSSTEKRDEDVQKSEVTRLKSKLSKKKGESVHDATTDDRQDLNVLTVPEVAKALVMIF